MFIMALVMFMKRYLDRYWKFINWAQNSILLRDGIRTRILRFGGAKIARTARVGSGNFFGSCDFELGEGVYINVNGFFDGSAKITVGEGVRFGPHVKILTGTHIYRNNVMRRSMEDGIIAAPVSIGRGCWLGIGVTVMPGVKIAEGCVIAAGSLVLKDTRPNGLYAGVPAKRLKDLPTF